MYQNVPKYHLMVKVLDPKVLYIWIKIKIICFPDLCLCYVVCLDINKKNLCKRLFYDYTSVLYSFFQLVVIIKDVLSKNP